MLISRSARSSPLQMRFVRDAGRHPTSGHCPIQCFVGSGAPTELELRPAERAAALRLRHLPDTPGPGADRWHYAATLMAANTGRSWLTSTPNALAARGITPNDIVNAVNAQSLTLPSGDAKMATRNLSCASTNMAPSIDALNDSDQTGRRRDDLSLRRGACPGRLGRPTECCAHRRKSFGAFDHHQERECLDS